ncbi:hypothetical protein LTR85_004233 [Meristemomyces frigidus]|nr:hypothetical protein LTR85_004233 [Meristemomyces frigidus]
MRSQLWEEMLRLYFPIHDQDTDFMYSRFLSRENLQPVNFPMEAAVDALCLVQLGTTHKSATLLHEAVARYDAAVRTLRSRLAEADAVHDDGVLGAVYILGFCGLFQAVSTDGHAQRTHHLGLESMLLERGPEAKCSTFAQLLLYNLRHLTMAFGLVDRKSVAFNSPAWRRCASLTNGLMTDLSNLVMTVPGLLEARDNCMRQPRRQASKLLNLLICLTTLERDLQAWLVRWMASFDGLPYWLVNAAKFPHFMVYFADGLNVFPMAFRFPSFSSGSAQTTYWIALLQVKSTILEMIQLRCGHPLSGRDRMLKEEARECAANLCQSIAWLTQPQHGSCGIIRASGPLHYAARWYANAGDLERLEWCRRVKHSIAQRGIASLYADNFGQDVGTPSSGSHSCESSEAW